MTGHTFPVVLSAHTHTHTHKAIIENSLPSNSWLIYKPHSWEYYTHLLLMFIILRSVRNRLYLEQSFKSNNGDLISSILLSLQAMQHLIWKTFPSMLHSNKHTIITGYIFSVFHAMEDERQHFASTSNFDQEKSRILNFGTHPPSASYMTLPENYSSTSPHLTHPGIPYPPWTMILQCIHWWKDMNWAVGSWSELEILKKSNLYQSAHYL